MTLESLARTIAKARHGTDAMWANYMPSARAVVADFAAYLEGCADEATGEPVWPSSIAEKFRALIAQPDGAQSVIDLGEDVWRRFGRTSVGKGET